LITAIGYEARITVGDRPELEHKLESMLRPSAERFVDYLLFVDEAHFAAPIEGNAGFAEKFALLGPFDKKGRSLRELDLKTRLLRLPCSYMINSESFTALPAPAKSAI